jgi:predicted nucleotidyltransferase
VEIAPASLDAIQRVFAAQQDVRAGYVFGSRAGGGQPRLDSDLDVGVLYRIRQPLETTVKLEGDLQAAVEVRIDLVDVGRAGAFLALDIIRGERVFTRDPVDTDRFELYVLRRAGDLLPFERQRQALLLHASQ